VTEEELEQRRKEYRDSEVQSKITEYSAAGAPVDAYHAQTLKSHYTKHKVDRKLSKIAWFLIISQASSIIFFSSLYVFTYIPKTKTIVTKVLP
jgi:hypothetical protein